MPSPISNGCHKGKLSRCVSQGLLGVCVTGAILKEIIEDLEWAASSTNSCVRVRMKKDPQQLIFSGEGAGDLEVGEGPHQRNCLG